MSQQTIVTEINGPVARVWLNRPDSRNALNGVMLEEMLSSLKRINADARIRVIILQGKGTSFCAGADLEWMRQAPGLTREENYKESEWPARCFHELFSSEKITIAGVQGYAFGGAMGFIAACDMAVSTESAVFAFPEVRLGLIPVTIAPYVFHKTGRSAVLEYLLTGKRFTGPEAAMLGLVNRVVPDDDLTQHLGNLTADLLSTAPSAQRSVKKLFRSHISPEPDTSTIHHTASLLAETRVSDEAVEGIRAFLEKRRPSWINI